MNFMKTAHQADQAIFWGPQRSNGLGSRLKPVNFVADLEANNLTKFHWDITNAHGDGLDHVLLDGLRGRGCQSKIASPSFTKYTVVFKCTKKGN
jgi:hypothetical protein